MAKPKLYNSWFCPFAQRAWIALLEKGVDFDLVEQDPYDKTPEWLAINPRGLVPTVVHKGKSVYESSICIEYVDESWNTGKHLLPRDPYERARARIWSDHVSKNVVPPFYRLLLQKSEVERSEARAAILEGVATLAAEMDPEGPFFSSESLGLVDIMLVPFAFRFKTVLSHYRGFTIPDGGRFTRYHSWYTAVSEVESVRKTLPDVQRLLESYGRYADGTATSRVAAAIKEGTAIP